MNIRVAVSFLWVSLGAFGAPEPPPSSSRLSLEDATRYAISHNFQVRALTQAVEANRGTVQTQRSDYYPKLGLAVGAEREVFGNQSQGAALGYGYATWNLFRGFRDRYKVDQAQFALERSKEVLERAKLSVTLEVESAFFNYLFIKVSEGINNDALALNRKHKALALRRRRSGMASQSDIMEFDLREALLQSNQAALTQEKEVARVNLKRLLGEQVGNQIEPVGDLKHYHLQGTLKDYSSQIKDTNQPIHMAALDLNIRKAQAKAWLGEWLPSVDLRAGAGYLPLLERGDNVNSAGWVVGIEARWEFFSGLGTQGRRRAQLARERQADSELKQTILNELAQMEIAYRRIKVIEERVHLEAKNVDRAKRYYKSVKSEYTRGVRNSADLRQAATGLFDSQQRLEQFKFDFINQRIELERALGSRAKMAPRAENDSH